MKTKLLLLFSFITFSNFAQTLPAYVPKSGLIAYYPFDNNANDISGNLNNGTVNGAVLTEDRTGKLNSAYSFNGVSSYIDATTTNIPQGNAARTISGWFKTNTPNSGENGDVCIFNYGTLSRLQKFGLTIYSKGYLQTSTGPNAIGDDFYVNNFDYLSNDWYFFTLTYNGTKVSLYVNGVLASEKVANLSTLNNIFRIGKRISGDTTSEFFKGTIDDIGIWNRVLTPQEISGMYVDAPERLDLYTLIPDSNFEKKLIELGLDSGAVDGKVLTNNLKTVKSLEIDTKVVSDLTGIESFTALETLICRGSQYIPFEGGNGKLTALNLSKNFNLKTLECSANQLTTLDVSKNTFLTSLTAGGNKIVLLDVSKNVALYKLDVNSNPITTIDVSKNININILDISNTKLTGFDVSQITTLTTLNVSGINIPTLDVSNNINLRSLNCDMNYSLTSLDLSKNTKLLSLSCTYNKITSLDVSKNLNLTSLYCASNQLTSLDLSSNIKLTELDLAMNNIASVDVSKCTSLTYLNCYANLLTNLNLYENAKLTRVDLDKNNLTSLDVSKNTALKTLHCGENQLTSITLPESNTLEVLYLNSNKFTALDISKYTALKEFVCSTNQLTAIDVSKNTALTFFHCHENNLTNLDITKNTLITSLYCQTNQLSTINVSKNKALTTFWCYGNQLTSLDVSQNTALTKLACNKNKLTTLNVKNGNNSNLNIYNSGFTNNPDLTCIQVDDVAYANTNWTAKKDATASFNTYCTDGYTLIPDVNFENKLIALDLDSGVADGKVLTEKIATVTNLNISSSSISDLTGIEGFTSLTYLSCDSNNLKSINVSKNTSLTDLHCGGNKLTTLDLDKNIALKKLTCSSNQLKSLNISKCSELEFIQCFYNSLTSLDLSNNTKLQILDCSNNQLTNLSLDKNVNLLALTAENNQLTTLDVKDNLILDLLDFSGNQIKTIDISNQKNLTQLFCGSNELKMLDISKNKALTTLNCSNNPPLQSLNLKNGNNSKIFSQALILSNNPALTCIEVDDVDYSNNNWANKKDTTANYNLDCPEFFTVIPDQNFEKKLIDLGIDSGTPDGKVATASITYIISLDVADSNISDLTGLQDFASLKYFFCDRNKLTTADFSKNLMLENIGILDNAFTSIDVTKNTKLHTLELSKNHISTVDLSQNTNLQRLGFENNNLKEIDLSHNTLLWFVSGFGNQLTNLDLSKNTALTTLNISNNKLVELNLRNGKNTILDSSLDLKNNPDLTCIKVDDVAYASANWASKKDNTASFSVDCLPTYTLIPDVNFENKLIALGIDSGTADGKVLTSNITSVTELDLYGTNINDLTGIENFKELTNLNCMSNKLESINVSKNIALTNLNVAYNKLTTIDVSKNIALDNFSAFNNELTQIDVSHNPSLQYFSCSSNPITAIDVSNNKALAALWCSSTSITNLDLSENTSLSAIFCAENKQLTNVNLKNGNNGSITSTSIDLTKNPLLTCILVDNALNANANWSTFKDSSASYSIVDCSQITAIPDPAFENKLIELNIDKDGKNGTVLNSSIVNVTSLNVFSSNIKDLTGIKGFANLQTLNCSGNQLSTLDISQNKKLNSLDCSNNKLVTLNLKNGNNSNFNNNSNFKQNPNLSCIQVDDQTYSNQNWSNFKDSSANYNVDCTAYTLLADSNFEQKLIDLGIDKDGLNGKIATSDISAITSLDLSNSNITDLSGIENFTALTYLDLSSNNITTIDVSKNILLTKLDLYNNQLTSLDVSKNTKLLNLSAGKNQITNLDISQNKSLLFVDVNSNLLTNFDLTSNTALKSIDCSDNKLTQINVSNMPDLTDLVCGKNNIASLDLSNNAKLENLYCYNNALTTLDLSKNPLLKRLNVSNNQLTTLDISHNPLLELIFVEFNPLVSLNVKNGNNKNFILATQTGKKTAASIYTSFLNNLKLSCIQVDDVAFSNANWAGIKDQTATYSSTCKSLGLEDSVFDQVAVYPNPTKGEVNIQNVSVEKVAVYDTNGKLVKSFQLNSNESNTKIDLSGLPRGVYYLYLINQDASSAKKIVVE